MSDLLIPHHAHVVVGDGRKALVLRNEGTPGRLHLVTVDVLEQDNPPSSEQGVAPPGRAFSSSGAGRSAYRQTDWHDLAEHAFARAIVAALEKLHGDGALKALVLVAPPRTLADLRAGLSPALAKCVRAEVDKDLTHHPVSAIEALLGGT